jgi:hypothetical protein
VSTCTTCDRDIGERKHARYCDECRSKVRRKRLKYIPTPRIDALIRETWLGKAWGLKAGRVVAARIGWPHWVVKRRAVALGVVRQKHKEAPWSGDELRVLEQFAWMSPQRIGIKLKQLCGTHRSDTGIILKRQRLKFIANGEWDSATGTAELLGIEAHLVTKWIKLGWLIAERRGTLRNERQGGDEWRITDSKLRDFVLAHPDEIDLAKIQVAGSSLWFLDLITGGRIVKGVAA